MFPGDRRSVSGRRSGRWPRSIAGESPAIGRVVAGALGLTIVADLAAATLPGFEQPTGFSF